MTDTELYDSYKVLFDVAKEKFDKELKTKFNSPMEGYAYILKAVEEAGEAQNYNSGIIEQLWLCIKNNRTGGVQSVISKMEDATFNLIYGAIQTWVMLEKYKEEVGVDTYNSEIFNTE